jgi:hypothetical protein
MEQSALTRNGRSDAVTFCYECLRGRRMPLTASSQDVVPRRLERRVSTDETLTKENLSWQTETGFRLAAEFLAWC